jgi:hypothetical protein
MSELFLDIELIYIKYIVCIKITDGDCFQTLPSYAIHYVIYYNILRAVYRLCSF